ncbi:hypothetical protein EHQ53_15640 [Leptospira langatensis]|uniref:Uncharacterized protein n=1 Tax=Leptospira langatensis TaxID=2484983 RepID=A0A5F1ZQM8_9LEPT|nr:hypothetical protein [Leptospira langatensis]TGK01897.1 hypothetical protein EHO57_08880 [Leptospira langatensis]TGL39502.1 hypothetical protein EHQ53_15640 [Leptospira langatensis]
MQRKIPLVFSLLFLIFILPLSALTPPPPLESQVNASNYIAFARLSNVKESKISSNSISVTATVEVLKALKGGSELPQKFDLAFLVFPELFGKWLKATPQEGEYILFLIKKKVKDSKGTESETIALYEPHPYAFREYSKELEEKILSHVKN